MGSVIDYISCPRCQQENCISDFYYKTGEEYVSCGDCGYYYSFVIKRDSEGKMIKIDETKELSVDNVITKETLLDNPYGSFITEFTNGIRSCGTLETKKDYDEFVSEIVSFTNQEHNIKQAIVSRLFDGNIIKEIIFKNN
jgi:Zn ribbon nucleic-acid-binding protein